MDESRLEIKVGALLAAALVAVGGLLWLLGELRFGGSRRLHVDFAHSGSVPSGAPVKLGGVRVGRVSSVDLLPDRRDSSGEPLPVRMTVDVDPPAFASLTADSRFVVATQGPLGEPFLEVVPSPSTGRALQAGSSVRGVDPPRMDLLSARLYSVLDAVDRILGEDPKAFSELFRRLASLTAKAEGGLDDSRPAIAQAVKDLSDAAHDLRLVAAESSATLGRGGDGRRILENLAAVSEELKREVPPIAQRTNQAVTGAAAVAGAFTPADAATLRDALQRYQKAGQALAEAADRADRLLARIEAGEGTVGGLAKDPKVYEDLKALVTDLKKHPWKMLWKE